MTGEAAVWIALFDIASRQALELYKAQSARRNGEMTEAEYEAEIASIVDRSKSRVLAAHAAWDNPRKED